MTHSVYPVGPTGICPRRKLASTLRTQFTAQTAAGTVLGHLSTRFMPIRAWRTTVLWAWGLVLLGLGHVGTKTVFLHRRPSPPYATAGWPFVGAGPWPSPLLLTEMLTTGMRKNARAQWRTVCIYWVQHAAGGGSVRLQDELAANSFLVGGDVLSDNPTLWGEFFSCRHAREGFSMQHMIIYGVILESPVSFHLTHHTGFPLAIIHWAACNV